MGMYATHETVEDSLCIDTKWLKEHDYFSGYKLGGITWTLGNREKASIGFIVDVINDFPKITFKYTVQNWRNEEKRSMNYSFPLVKVPCNLGGFRWAFQCALYKNGQYCGKTVYKLYKTNNLDYFGCRECMNIVYKSQRESGSRFKRLKKIFDIEEKYEEVLQSIHKWHYKGKPTKKVKKLKKLQKQIPSVAEAEVLFENLFS